MTSKSYLPGILYNPIVMRLGAFVYKYELRIFSVRIFLQTQSNLGKNIFLSTNTISS
jgi:hypothetical protein